MSDAFSAENRKKYNDEAASMASEKRRSAFIKGYGSLIGRLGLDGTKRLVDLGCGTGNLAAAVKNKVSGYIGYDLSDVAINIAQERRLKNATFICADLLERGHIFDQSDILVSISCIDQMKNRQEFLLKLRKAVTGDNRIYVEVRNGGYLFKRCLRWIIPILEKLTLVVPTQSPDLVDLTHQQWIELFSNSGFEIKKLHKSARPFYFENGVELVKISLHELCKILPYNNHYMIGYELQARS